MARKKEQNDPVADIEEPATVKADDTIISNIEQIVNIAVEEKLGDSVFQQAQANLEFVANRLGISQRQALLFSLFVELSNYKRIDSSDIASLTRCRRVRVLSLLSEDKALVDKGLLVKRKHDGESDYFIPYDAFNAIKNNETFENHKKQLNIDDFFEAVMEMCDYAEKNNENFQESVDELVDSNIHLDFCKAFRKYFCVGDSEGALFMVFAHKLINEDDDDLGEYGWEKYFCKRRVRIFRTEFDRRNSYLVENHLLEEVGTDGMRDNYYHRITNQAKDEFFVGMEGLKCESKKQKNTKEYTSITEKKLYYNENEEKQIAQLTDLLLSQNFTRIQQRLTESGLRKGFACLFYGVPGTGKTETVYQIARTTGRDLMVIDVASIKSCWVGESEKNITESFLHYKQCVESCRKEDKNEPILLFNEADAILSIRKERAESAVDKMENSIQNIILQQMECLDGIMIATTNLTSNLDKAFERRFIYKIEFCRPTKEVKCAIWKSMMPELTDEMAQHLSDSFDFSGGQIENIARKSAVEKILSGKNPTEVQLNEFCQQEAINNTKFRKIGF